jgi:hypothetical protein
MDLKLLSIIPLEDKIFPLQTFRITEFLNYGVKIY